MRSSVLFLLALFTNPTTSEYSCPTATPAGVKLAECEKLHCPEVKGGQYRFVGGKEVPHTGKVQTVLSPVYILDNMERMPIGTLPDMTGEEAVEAVEAAAAAWDRGQGTWPRMPIASRIAAIEKLVEALIQAKSDAPPCLDAAGISKVRAFVRSLASAASSAAASAPWHEQATSPQHPTTTPRPARLRASPSHFTMAWRSAPGDQLCNQPGGRLGAKHSRW